jgi:hypothetical protein
VTADVQTTEQASTGIARWQKPSLIIGVLGLAASVIGWFLQPAEFYRSYLSSYIFWFAIVAGSLGILMLQYITRGEWGIMIRRPLGAAARTMIWMAVFFIPIVAGMRTLYPWMQPNWLGHEPLIRAKMTYLSWQRWIIVAVFYFACWIWWAWRIRILSLKFYEDRSPYTNLARNRWAGAGLPMIVLTLTFASIDWIMSLEPRWHSTMYGITFVVGCGLSAMAFVTFFLSRLADTEAMQGILKPSHLRDLGNLLLTFTMFFAYVFFSEFLLIWYANIHDEIPYYIARVSGVWGALGILIIIFHFFLPFFMLLMRPIKDKPGTIAIVTVIILVMRYVYFYWLIEPAWTREHFHYSIWSLTSLVGIGGVWLWAFINQLKGQTIIPIHETWVEEAVREGALRVNA